MDRPRISIIVAIDDKRGIGKENKLLFKIAEDLRRFKQLTTEHAIIMGRKTFDSIGRVLPNRTNIIVTRDPNFKVEGAIICNSLKDAMRKAKNDNAEIFIIGGGQIFEAVLKENLVDRLYITKVKGDYHADTFFPDYTQDGFTKSVAPEKKSESDGYTYTFLTLEK